jgi:hypothetical protein
MGGHHCIIQPRWQRVALARILRPTGRWRGGEGRQHAVSWGRFVRLPQLDITRPTCCPAPCAPLQAYRDWGVELVDWQSQASMLATQQDLTATSRRMMPTVGAQLRDELLQAADPVLCSPFPECLP